MTKPIKSPIGEVVSDAAYDKGVEYMTEENAQALYKVVYHFWIPGYREPGFANWLEAQGVKLV